MWRRHRAAIFLGLLGLVAGGLFGLILGVVAGLAVDRMRSDLGSGLSAEREVSRAGVGGRCGFGVAAGGGVFCGGGGVVGEIGEG